MDSTVPDHLKHEQQALEAEIREAFKGVTREGGVSWSESEVRDLFGDEEERRAARDRDTERDWIELATDRRWDSGPGVGGFNFLDPIGYRYYLPAAMIRTLHDAYGAATTTGLEITLNFDGPCREGRLLQVSLLNDRQRRCVARFLRLMADCYDDDESQHGYRAAYESHWKSLV